MWSVRSRSAQRIGQLKTGQDWDLLVLVLLDEAFEAFEIYEADRETIEDALDGGAGSSRARRGAMTVARMKAIVTEAMGAGAIGFATSRAGTHVGYEGRPVPSRACDVDEGYCVPAGFNG